MSRKLQKSSEYSFVFNNLIDICAQKNVTVTSLIEKYQSSSALQAWKNGKINTEIIPNLAFDLDVSIEYLLTGKEKSFSDNLLESDIKCLEWYRKLTPIDQIRIIEHMAAWYEKYTPEEKEKAS